LCVKTERDACTTISIGTNAATSRINGFCKAPRPRHPNQTGPFSSGIDEEPLSSLHARAGVRNLRPDRDSVFSLKFSFSLISRHSTSRLELISPLYTQAHTLIRSGVRPSANARSSLRSQRDVRAPRKRPSWRPCSSRLTHTAPFDFRAHLARSILHARYGAPCPIRRSVPDTALRPPALARHARDGALLTQTMKRRSSSCR
jgi:hypothetical protein